MCFDPAGLPLATFSTFTEQDNVAADGTATFTVEIFDESQPCESFLVGGSGYDSEAL